jgi:hypothetical protein
MRPNRIEPSLNEADTRHPCLSLRGETTAVRVFAPGAILVHLAEKFGAFLGGDDYIIADIAVWPWHGGLAKGLLYGAGEFLSVQDYKNVQRGADTISQRPAVKRGRMVNRLQGDPASQLHERHDASDFETKTQDKLATGN